MGFLEVIAGGALIIIFESWFSVDKIKADDNTNIHVVCKTLDIDQKVKEYTLEHEILNITLEDNRKILTNISTCTISEKEK